MALPALDNLAKIGELKPEPPREGEVEKMLQMARTFLADAQLKGPSLNVRFLAVYSASHAAALAALRWHGYRSEHRFIVFQCLEHTVQWEAARWRALDLAHRKRNIAEYEGSLEVEESMVTELIALAKQLIGDVANLTQPKKK